MQRPVRTADVAAFFRATQGQQERRNEHLAESPSCSSDYPFGQNRPERPNCNPENERLKRRYFVFLKEARRLSEAAVDTSAAALHRFEVFTRFVSFRAFHLEQAVAFKRSLRHGKSDKGQTGLSSATVCSTLHALRCFFEWLADQPGFRGRITHSLAQYFNPTEKEGRIASARREAPFPSLEQLARVVSLMPTSTDVEKRDRALFAFTVLTTARVFEVAFERAGLPYFHPHTLRKTITQLGERCCHTPEEFKAWSQNLGHEDVRTTFNSYGQVAPARQEEIIRKLHFVGSGEEEDEALSRQILELLRKKGKGMVPA
jgi:site-specific recombinase XerD